MKKFCKVFISSLFVLSLLMTFVSCGQKVKQGDVEEFSLSMSSDQAFFSKTAKEESSNVDYEAYAQKFVVSADIECETKAFDKSADTIEKLTEENGGYIEHARLEQDRYSQKYSQRYNVFTIRIPIANYHKFLEKISDEFQVTSKATSQENVTQSYYENESHINSLLLLEEKYIELLKTAESVETMLSIEKELADVRREIAFYQTMQNVLENQIDYATIALIIYEVENYSDMDSASYWNSIKYTFKKAWKDFGQGCKDFFRDLVGAIPILLVLGVIAGINAIIVVIIVKSCKKKKIKEEQAKIAENKNK